jgi:lysyl-tRNA synthetase class 2
MRAGDLLRLAPDGAEFYGQARLLSMRKLGKICFCGVRFREDNAQIMLGVDLPNFGEITRLPLGSLISIRGKKFVSKTGEPTLRVTEANIEHIFADTMPDKYHGLSSGHRYRDRTKDLIVNAESFLFARKMSAALSTIRQNMYRNGFHEFITGVLQERFEGGQANSFSTSCRANNRTLHLSLTSELKLKRLIVSGFERVFEVAQSFRNEGIDAIHSPEFTLLEAYAVGFDCSKMMEILEQMVCEVVMVCEGSSEVPYVMANGGVRNVSYQIPFKRIPFRQAFEEAAGAWSECDINRLSQKMPESFNLSMTRFTWLMKVIEKMIAPSLVEPTFLTELPVAMSPFVKNHDSGEASDRGFLFAQGVFLADVYTDENRLTRVEEALRAQSTETKNPPNEEYLEALRLGIPPTAGIGMGLNRLFMLLLHGLPQNIKETMLYPIL